MIQVVLREGLVQRRIKIGRPLMERFFNPAPRDAIRTTATVLPA